MNTSTTITPVTLQYRNWVRDTLPPPRCQSYLSAYWNPHNRRVWLLRLLSKTDLCSLVQEKLLGNFPREYNAAVQLIPGSWFLGDLPCLCCGTAAFIERFELRLLHLCSDALNLSLACVSFRSCAGNLHSKFKRLLLGLLRCRSLCCLTDDINLS